MPSPSHSSTAHSLCISTVAILLGLTRALVPLAYLQVGLFTNTAGWLLPLAHLGYHLSAIAGTAIGPRLLAKRKLLIHQMPFFAAAAIPVNSSLHHLLFLSIALKALSLVIFSLCLLFHPPSASIFFPILGIGLGDGMVQRQLLMINVLQRTRRLESGNNNKNDNNNNMMIQLLVQFSAGPLLAALCIASEPSSPLIVDKRDDFPLLLIRQIRIRFTMRPAILFGGLALFQAILLHPLRPQAQGMEEEGLQQLEAEGLSPPIIANSPNSPRNEEMGPRGGPTTTAAGFALLVPLYTIGALAASQMDALPYALFSLLPNGPDADFWQHRDNFLLFAAFSLFARLLLALLPFSSASHSSLPPASSLSPNILFPIGLFGSGFALLCAMNAPALRQLAMSIYGASLALIWPATLLHCQHSQLIGGHPRVLVKLLIASQIGPLLFPIILTQLFGLYGGSQLFTSVALLAILLMVVSFVCLLNAQAEQQQRTTTSSKNQFWGWFLGERGRRTRRSIRRFVRNVRGSLKRHQKATSRCCQKRRRVGTADMALLEESSVGPVRSNYQSTQALDERIPVAVGRQLMEETVLENVPQGDEGAVATIGLMRRAQFSLPSIIVHQGTPSCQSAKSLQSLLP